MDSARQELKAVEKANRKLRSIPTGGTGASKKFVDALDLLVFNLTTLHNAYTFVSEHRDFYNDASEYDVGVSLEGINLYSLLAQAANSSSGFMGDCKAVKSGIRQSDLKWVLPQLEGAGYIKYLDSYCEQIIYVTTGKYESAILRQKYWDKHPEEKITEDTYIKEKSDAAYDAAVTFAKLDGYKDSMARSLDIWKKRILPNLHDEISIGHYALTADGRMLLSNIDESNKMRDQWEKLKDTKQIVSLGQGQFIALGYNGRLKSYIDYKNSLREPIAQLEKVDKKIISIANYSGRCIAFQFEDGTVQFCGELSIGSGFDERKMPVSQIRWSGIQKIDICSDSIVGLKKDGTIIVVGNAEAYTKEFSNWKNVVDIKICDYGEYIIAKTSVGQYLIAGKKPENYDAVSTWKNVIDVIDYGDIPMGLTRNGSLLWGSTKNKRVHANTARMFAQRGIVAMGAGIALKADGTIYTADKTEDYSDWQNIVCVKHDPYHDYAICANGSVLVREKESKKAPEAREAEKWKLFNHIDTLHEERQKAQANSHDDYFDNKNNQRKHHRKLAVIAFLLSAFVLSSGLYLALDGDTELLPFLIGGIGGIALGIFQIKEMNNV